MAASIKQRLRGKLSPKAWLSGCGHRPWPPPLCSGCEAYPRCSRRLRPFRAPDARGAHGASLPTPGPSHAARARLQDAAIKTFNTWWKWCQYTYAPGGGFLDSYALSTAGVSGVQAMTMDGLVRAHGRCAGARGRGVAGALWGCAAP
jgi:hypothetical protein